MTSELEKQLRALREIAPRLNAAADEANRIVAMVDEQLREMGIGITATSRIFATTHTEANGDRCEITWRLGYDRVGGEYAIHILEETMRGPEGCDHEGLELVDQMCIPWSTCNRETRLAAFKELPGLLDSLLREAKSVVGSAERTTQLVRVMTADDES